LTLATLVVSQRSGEAGEPLQLALVSQNHPAIATPSTTNTVKSTTKAATIDTNSFTLSVSQRLVTPSLLSPAAERAPDNAGRALTFIALTKKPSTPPAGSLAALFNGLPGNGNFGFSNFEAGYGQAYEADSIILRGRNGTTLEEPRYIFFKKIVKF
jgi:hypothetical protein